MVKAMEGVVGSNATSDAGTSLTRAVVTRDLAADAFEMDFRRGQATDAAPVSPVPPTPLGRTVSLGFQPAAVRGAAGSNQGPGMPAFPAYEGSSGNSAGVDVEFPGAETSEAGEAFQAVVTRETPELVARTGTFRLMLMYREGTVYAETLAELLPLLHELMELTKSIDTNTPDEIVRSALWWLDVYQPTLADMDEITEVAPLHPLTIEDCVAHDSSREKWEVFETTEVSYLFCTTHEVCLEESEEIALHMIVRPTSIITVHMQPSDAVAEVRDRMKSVHSDRVPSIGWTMCALIDSSVEKFDDHTDAAVSEISVINELALMLSSSEEAEVLHRMKNARTRHSVLFRQLMPKRQLLQTLSQQEIAFVSSSVRLYFRDVLDQVSRQIQAIESAREVLSTAHANYIGTINLELSKSSKNVGDAMANLSIGGTIFLPLTFITGAMGMNVRVPQQFEGGDAGDPRPFWYICIICVVICGALYLVLNRRLQKRIKGR
eukprot:c485_g1_i1.p1 GENE.c485_g1_i1~~c485_g1_i1.p1  ORF type:complete len:569 (+),score=97.78 c485_g1_i1:237-1709(+)